MTKIITLDGVEMPWRPGNRKQNKHRVSKLQGIAINAIFSVLPGTPLILEIPIPVTTKKNLRLDIYLPRHRLAFEVMGAQHFKQVSHFGTNKDFHKQKVNDELKKEWCQLNNIGLIYLNYNEKEEEWIAKIRSSLNLSTL